MKQRDLVRSIYLYLATAAGIIVALTGAIGALSGILNLYVFHLIPSESTQSVFETLLRFISCVAVGIPVWLYHWGIIQGIRHAAPTPAVAPAGAAAPTENRRDLVRRLYIYLLSAIGLGIVIGNLISLLPNVYSVFWKSSASIGVPTVPGIRGSVYDAQQLIRTIVAIVIGTPVWLYHWHLGQREYRKSLEE